MARTPEQRAAYNAGRREERRINPGKAAAREREYYARTRDRRRAEARARYVRNKDKIRGRANRRNALNPELVRLKNMLRVHGLRPEGWAALWQQQDGRCYLCDAELPPKGLLVHVDHDHRCCPAEKSCMVCRRGLACNGCNVALGHVKDDPGRLRRMADALEKANMAVTGRMNERGAQLNLYEETA